MLCNHEGGGGRGEYEQVEHALQREDAKLSVTLLNSVNIEVESESQASTNT